MFPLAYAHQHPGGYYPHGVLCAALCLAFVSARADIAHGVALDLLVSVIRAQVEAVCSVSLGQLMSTH